ncbi:unnamed protein product [Parnassius apollo]|uniref:(apollo) hypothetical protein n=1 Tax=Parnassius apollo TaxID=110799 RepID=A0A8S3Y4A1_PARAO|nr:unnamed protein product [Parnassius apollo]
MNHEKEIAKRFIRNDDNTKFICSICLNAKSKCNDNKKPECNKRKSKSCPICQRGLENGVQISSENKLKLNKSDVKEKPARVMSNHLNSNTKTVQTSQTDVSHGLNLLNEVLTVFQSKKKLPIEKENHGKTVIVKDASVATEYLLSNKEIKPKLTVSKIFRLSIEDSIVNGNNNFTIVNYSQPQRNKNSQYSIDLSKHKSSSIPQMKLEELKNSLKEKAKSKDAIEEVNRMFATVKKNAVVESLGDTNRPMIRNGPRVLPVVKTKTYENECSNNTCTIDDNNSGFRKAKEIQNCKFCQTNNYLLSSGDFLLNPDSCHQIISDKMCSKCIHMVKCRHHNYRQIHDVCQHCCQRCMENRCHHNYCEENHDGDSCTSF